MPDETPATKPGGPRLPPRWVIRFFWFAHRAIYSVTGGRFGLRPATPTKWGMMRLHTTGRKSGAERVAILGFFEDGANVVTMAMNGWGAPEPAWWLNLQAKSGDDRRAAERSSRGPWPSGHARGTATALGEVGGVRR